MCLNRLDQLGVCLERPVQGPSEGVPRLLIGQLTRDDVLPPSVGAVGIRDIARRLLEIRHQPSPLEHFGQDVRHALAGDVGAAELGDGVVSVLVEHPRVETFCPFQTDLVLRRVTGNLVQKLVEEQTTHALGRPGVAGEQRAFDNLWKVCEYEYRIVDVAEVWLEQAAFFVGELFGDVCRRGRVQGPTV